MHKCLAVAIAVAFLLAFGGARAQEAREDELGSLLNDDTQDDPASAPAEPPAESSAASDEPQPEQEPPEAIPVQGTEPAPPPPASRRSVIEEIIVTARRREESLQDVPVTMSAFTGDQMSALGIVDTRDLAKLVPGFRYADTGVNVPFFSIRGVGFDASSQVANATVGLYLDEFNLPFPVLVKGPNLDLERTEILKGPQGTLYGRNTTAGAVNYITRAPTKEVASGLSASYGRFATLDLEGFLSGPVSETFGLRVAARQITAAEGWQRSLTRPDGPNGELGKKDKLSARLTAQWVPGDALDITAFYDYWEDQSDAQAAQALLVRAANQQDERLSSRVRSHPVLGLDNRNLEFADWPVEQTENLPNWEFNDKFHLGRLRANWDVLEDASLIYLGSYGRFTEDDAGIPQSGLSVPNFESRFFVETKYWNNELRLDGSWGENIGYVAGVFLSHDDVDNLFTGYAKTSSALFPHDAEGNAILVHFADLIGIQQADTSAIFASMDWEFLTHFRATFGARYTKDERDFGGCSRDNPEDTAPEPGLAGAFNALSIQNGGTGGAMEGDCVTLDEDGNPGLIEKSLAEDNLSGRLSLDWRPLDDTLFYLSYSRGFKSGSFNVLTAAQENQYDPVVQEQVDALEIGTKLTLLEAYRLNAAGFYYDYRDKQLLGTVLNPVFGPLPALVNAPKTRVQGAEVELQAAPLENLSVLLSAMYLDTKILEHSGLNEFGQNQDFAGNSFSYSPNVTATAGVNYRWMLPWQNAFELTPGLGVNYSGRASASNSGNPLFELPDFHNVDASLGFGPAGGQWLARLWGYNVTDEYQPISAGSARSGDAITRYVQMPRTYGVAFRYNW